MSSYIKFNSVLDELDSILANNQKTAEAISDGKDGVGGNVLDGNRKATDGQGKKLSELEQTDSDVDQEQLEPSRTDDGMKSVEDQIATDAKETKVQDKALRSESEKLANQGDGLLKDIYRLLLSKKAQEEEEAKNGTKAKEDDDETMTDEEVEEAMAEAEVDVELTPEDEEVLKALGAKTAAHKAEYLMSKQAGAEFRAELEKAGYTIVPADAFQKQANYMAGSILSQLENEGAVVGPQQLEKLGYDIGQLIEHVEKQAFQKGYLVGKNRNVVERENIVKEASSATAESVLQALAKRDMGKKINEKYASLINP